MTLIGKQQQQQRLHSEIMVSVGDLFCDPLPARIPNSVVNEIHGGTLCPRLQPYSSSPKTSIGPATE